MLDPHEAHQLLLKPGAILSVKFSESCYLLSIVLMPGSYRGYWETTVILNRALVVLI